MPTPAVTQIRNALAAVLAATLPLHSIIKDRPRGDAIDVGEMPAVIIVQGDWEFELFEQRSSMLHNVTFDLEIYERSQSAGTPSIADQQNDTISKIVAAIAADYTLGGRLQDMRPTGAGSPESNPLDAGAIQLSVATQFLTPPGDFFTIQGQSGSFT